MHAESDPTRLATAVAGATPINTAADLDGLAARASRVETACDGDTVVWHIWGADTDPPTVLLHGGSGSWTHWARNIEPLVLAGRRVLVPDMPGFGDSSLPTGVTDVDGLPGPLEASLAVLIGDVVVEGVGFSLGGLAAGLWAAAQPRRFSHLVLVGAPALSAEPITPIPLRAWMGLPAGPVLDAVHRHNVGQLMLAGEASIDDLALHIQAHNAARDRLRRRKLMRTDLLLRTLPALRCPVSGIWGEQDVLYRNRMEVVGQALTQAPGFRSLRLLPGAGHWAPYEDAPAFNAALAELLKA